jgi:hypothetical protein
MIPASRIEQARWKGSPRSTRFIEGQIEEKFFVPNDRNSLKSPDSKK